MPVLNIPILRWGQPYTSLETDDVVHFVTGETLARVSQANTGLLGRDMRLALHARQLGFKHPGTGKKLMFEVPIPEAFGDLKL